MKKIKRITWAAVCLLAVMVCALFANQGLVLAKAFTVSPPSQKIALVPGQTYYGSFKVSDPAYSEEDFSYKITPLPFYMDENYHPVYEEKGDYNQIVDWVDIENPEGVVKPNEVREIHFTINVPQSAPAGGQYVALAVTSNDAPEVSGNTNIQQILQFSHMIYAEVAGETVHNVSLKDINIPSFILGGNLSATVMVMNEGNTHADVESVLQVFPLFSDEEIYTNEKNPDSRIVMPDSKRLIVTAWDKAPAVGIFNVVYTVSVDGQVMGKTEKMVIICPLWLIFVITVVIVALIIWIVIRIKTNEKKVATTAEKF